MKNKLIGIVLIIFSFFSIYFLICDDVNSIIYQNKIINKNFKNYGNTTEYLGYIEIKKININKLIKEGISSEILDELYVGHVENSSNLDCEYGNIILAGHNTYSVFSKLKKLEINDLISLYSINNKYDFKIIIKKEILKMNSNYFREQNKTKLVTLITCTNDKNKRLLIIAKKV